MVGVRLQATLEHRLRELAFLNSGVRIVLTDARHAEIPCAKSCMYEGGVEAFVAISTAPRSPVIEKPVASGGEGRHHGRVALWWNDSYHENVLCFTNNIPQRDGGTHLAGFRAALTRQVTGYAESSGIAKKEKVTLTGDDCREGLTCVLSVKVPDPKFSSPDQGQAGLLGGSPGGRERRQRQALSTWLEEHPNEAKTIVGKVVGSRRRPRGGPQGARADPPQGRARHRLAARQAGRLSGARPGQAPSCSSSRVIRPAARPSRAAPVKSGHPAAARQDPECRAGALRQDAVLGQVGTLITALGTGIGRDERDTGAFNIEKLRYHKIVIMTDADVDGAHIRTLLLTFFYRQMPELIDRGHLFIAQPPLYKATRGKSQTYLKDERALEDYLVDGALDGAVFRTGDGSERGGADLRALIEEARSIRHTLSQLHSRYDRRVVEQTAIAGALRPQGERSEAELADAAAYVARRLDAISDEIERGWEGKAADGGFTFSRLVRGVKQVVALDAGLLASAEARRLDAAAPALQEAYGRPGVLSRKGDDHIVNGPSDLFDAVNAIGRKGVALQRYKGLGEMNPDQLWETTLDRDVRSLLRVKNDQNDEADDLFVKLMGDVVEPRREFIQSNALNATVDT